MRVIFTLGLLSATAFARSGGPDPGLTGAPGEGTCAACHGNGTVNSGGGNLKVELLNQSKYTPGAQHRLRITLADATAQRWGFQLSARLASAPTQRVGTLAPDNATEVQVRDANNVQYIEHRLAGTHPGTSGSSTWEILWTAPQSAVGDVIFYAAGNAANGNGSADGGDKIYSTSLTIAASDDSSTGNSRVLPQFVWGDLTSTVHFYTAIYLSNSAGTPATVNVQFKDDNGADLDVPGYGAKPAVNISARGTTVIETPFSGAFKSGWVELQLPAGVTGYGVFRQSVDGRAPQEAVVPLSDDSKTAWTIIFDDIGLTTSLAILNPGDTSVNIQVTARDTGGVEVGNANVALAAKKKTASALKDIPGMSSVAGKRGSIEFSVPTGRLGVLGLRFGPEAFTSIPASER